MTVTVSLESIHNDAQTEILLALESYRDLENYLRASPLANRAFWSANITVLTQITKNIFGDAWKAATTILIYQRGANQVSPDQTRPDYAAEKYVFQKEDIANVIANQEFFKHCAEKFEQITGDTVPGMAGLCLDSGPLPIGFGRERDWESEYSDPPPESPAAKDSGHSFLDGKLPRKYFYETWLLSIQFGADTIRTFAQRKALSLQGMTDLKVLTIALQLVDDEKLEKFIAPAFWSPIYDTDAFAHLDSEGAPMCNMFQGFDWNRFDDTARDGTGNLLLYWKAKSHLNYAMDTGPNAEVYTDLRIKEERMETLRDLYPVLSVEEILEKYAIE